MKKIKQIIFTEPFPTVMVYKMAKLFRENGYETILILLLENKGVSKQFHKGAFDKIISLNLNFYRLDIKNLPLILLSLLKKSKNFFRFAIELTRLNPYILITRASPSWPCRFFHYLFNKTPWIYFPYDIRTQYYKTPFEAKRYGNLPAFELKSERFCFENSTGIIHKGSPEELNYLGGRMLGNNLKLPPFQLNFFPYTSKEFIVPFNSDKLSKQDKGVHVVHIDSMGNVGPIGAKYVYDTLSFFVNQKINIHIYSRPNSISKEEIIRFFKQDSQFTRDYESLLKSKYFHFHLPLEPNEITKEISKYDFGLSPKAPVDKPSDIEPCFSMGNKLSTYLEAGIPLISHNSVKFLAKIRDYYQIGVSFEDNKKNNLKSALKKLDYKKLEENIKFARNDFSMEKHFSRLLDFVKKVVSCKD